MMQDLIDLVGNAWRHHGRFHDREYVVTPSAPVLYFGDRNAYMTSPIRIITVGLNPSKAEFPTLDPFLRFAGADGGDPASYLSSLDSYFRSSPYTRWFRPSFESLLNGLCGSYFSGEVNTALHTDLCSPLATDPTWSKLDRGESAELQLEGVKLWHDLVRHLRPDLILISVARKYMGLIEFTTLEPFKTIFTVERKNPYEVDAARIMLDQCCHPQIVFGKAAQLPFGKMSSEDKRKLGTFLHEKYFGEKRTFQKTRKKLRHMNSLDSVPHDSN
jgi:hypothetical protein